jgi:two-component sensor histidine kinase
MVMNELCTNAVKHGAWSNNAGMVEISWTQNGDKFGFRWSERNGPPVTTPTHTSFGTRLIAELLPREMGGKASLVYAPSGFNFEFEAPLSALARNY